MGERTTYTDKKGNVLVDKESSPELYVDGVWGLTHGEPGGIVKITLYSNGLDGGEKGERRDVVCRLVMAVPTFLSMASFIDDAMPHLLERAKGSLNQMPQMLEIAKQSFGKEKPTERANPKID